MSVADHLPPNARAFLERDRRWCHTQAQAVGQHCLEPITRLLAERIAERLRAAQAVLTNQMAHR